jgi:NADPH-dependent 2,4-dienoyl-CoA reductase/sulfur reductase-like enzyme
VDVVEKLPQILPGWEPESVERVREELERRDVGVHTGVDVAGFRTHADGRVAAVETDAGLLEADMVLVAVGVRPDSGLAAEAGIVLGAYDEIRVDRYQQSSHPAVWAAGDCTSAYDRVLGRFSWVPLGTTANKQGRVAGANAVGHHIEFPGIVATSGFKVFELEVARCGLTVNRAAEEGFEPVSTTIIQPSRAHAFPGSTPIQVKLVADRISGRLLGGELVGREHAAMRVNVLAAALAARMSVSDVQALDMVYAPPFAPVWDPILVAANQLVKRIASS